MDMDPEEVREGLEKAGLTAYQADAYITLLDRGVSPAVDVAKNCSVPVPRIYDVLKDLEQQGYIETFEQDTLHARAKNPVDVIQDLHDRSEMIADTAGAIEDAWEQASLADHKMSVVKHADTVIDQAESLIRDATNAVDVALTVDQFEELTPAIREATENGAITRVSLFVELGDPTAFDASRFEDVAAEIRTRNIPGPFLALVDRTHTCFAPNNRSSQPYGVILNDSILSFIFYWYFQTCTWSIWEPVYRRSSDEVTYVSLEQFIREMYPIWRHGGRITVEVKGTDIETSRPRSVSGRIRDIVYTDIDLRSSRPPTFGQLAGQVTITLETEEGFLSVGGWGAVFEDIEAQRIVLRDIEVSRNALDPIARGYAEGGHDQLVDRIASQVRTTN